jgi:hypothetical protein
MREAKPPSDRRSGWAVRWAVPITAFALAHSGEAKARAEEPAQAEIVFRADFKAVRIDVLELEIDGKQVERIEKRGIDANNGVTLFHGTLSPGAHRTHLRATMNGSSPVFSYLRGYSFDLSHEGTMITKPGELTRVVINARQEGAPTRPWKERIKLRPEATIQPIAVHSGSAG